jgi:hypothetical protein
MLIGSAGDRLDLTLSDRFTAAKHFVPENRAGRRLTFDGHHPAQLRKLRSAQLPRPTVRQLRAYFGQHCEIIGRLETIDEKQRFGVALFEHVRQLKRPICRVDRDQHGSDPGRGEL